MRDFEFLSHLCTADQLDATPVERLEAETPLRDIADIIEYEGGLCEEYDPPAFLVVTRDGADVGWWRPGDFWQPRERLEEEWGRMRWWSWEDDDHYHSGYGSAPEDLVHGFRKHKRPPPPGGFALRLGPVQSLGETEVETEAEPEVTPTESACEGLVLADVAYHFTMHRVVSTHAPLLDVIAAMGHPLIECCFLADRSHIMGVVDLQCLLRSYPLALCLFSLALGFEDAMLRVLNKNPLSAFESLPPGAQDQAREYWRCVKEGEVARVGRVLSGKVLMGGPGGGGDRAGKQARHDASYLVRAATLPHKWRMLAEQREDFVKLPFASRKEADRFFSRLKDLRNAVAHGRPLEGLFASAGELAELVERCRLATEALRT